MATQQTAATLKQLIIRLQDCLNLAQVAVALPEADKASGERLDRLQSSIWELRLEIFTLTQLFRDIPALWAAVQAAEDPQTLPVLLIAAPPNVREPIAIVHFAVAVLLRGWAETVERLAHSIRSGGSAYEQVELVRQLLEWERLTAEARAQLGAIIAETAANKTWP